MKTPRNTPHACCAEVIPLLLCCVLCVLSYADGGLHCPQVHSGEAAAVLSNDSDFAVAEECLMFPLECFEWGAPTAAVPGYVRGQCYR